MECIYDFLFDWIAYHHFVIIPGMMVHMQCSYLCIGIIVFFLFNTDCDCHRAYRNLYQKINAQAVDQTSVRIFDRIMMRTSMLRKKKKTTCISTTIFFHIFFLYWYWFYLLKKKKKKYLVFSTIKDIQCLMIKIRTINILVIEVSVFFHVSLYN